MPHADWCGRSCTCRRVGCAQIDYTVNGTEYGFIGKCASKLIFAPPTGVVNGASVTFPGFENGTPDPIPLIVIRDPGSTCVHAQGTLGMTMLCMVMFSLCVQVRTPDST